MTTLRDISLVLARVILGVVLFAHGWQKYNDWTIAGTGQSFGNAGVPYPELSAQFATYFEMVGGALLILGLLVRFIGPILAIQMAGAFWFMHRGSGIFASDGGWELVGVIAAAGLALSAAGAGRISLDHLLTAPFRKRKEKKEAEKNAEAAAEAPTGTAGATTTAGAAYPAGDTATAGTASTASTAGAAGAAYPADNADAATTAYYPADNADAATTAFPAGTTARSADGGSDAVKGGVGEDNDATTVFPAAGDTPDAK
ncbi:DoxX family protein [Corynebacterium sp. 320]|uniref:DoxX family protein n=1 Tax=Corynebacterium TaxID=1716 RepID=UPI00125CC227|nr:MULTISPECIES: DoxX family protein [Corynebacterium]KAB1504385.1 DoxX family protein [Corynebacterium sp. 320]KAB1552516.1 DoxX family protein [Corynebacterium sp. 321]KAB3528521.1 DoxX family protein [Corynebacterium sp. 250]QNP92066.1 DoxX family protein [Corynebacterium zhongnanshanii]